MVNPILHGTLPTVDNIDGIKIDCYSADHLPPHVHAIYNEHEALIEIKTRNIYAGSLPPKQLKKAKLYITSIEKDLLEIFYTLNERLRPHVPNTPDTKNL